MSPWLPFGVFGTPLASFGFHLALFGTIWLPLESIWSPLGSICLPLGVHLGVFGVPLGLLGPLGGSLGCQGAYSRFCQKMGLQFRANGSHVRSLSTKVDLMELISGDFRGSLGITGDPPIPWKCDLAGSSQPPFLAPGARMTVVKHTPSN